MIIGFCGKKGSGKDYATSVLKKLHPGALHIIRFSQPLKDMCYMMGLTFEDVEGKMKERPTHLIWDGKNVSARQAQQKLSDNLKQHMGEHVFLDIAMRKLDALRHTTRAKDTIFAFPDVRFPYEVDALIERGGLIVKLERSPWKDSHNSEISVDNIAQDKFALIIKDADKRIYKTELEKFYNRALP